GFLSFFGTITGLLAVTFLAFTRMDKDVRRARMFIMEKRIQRFLGAFTFGFIALTVLICASTIAFGLPAAIGTGLLVVWLGGMGYGTYELLLRSEEHTSELQSRSDLVCRLLLEKKNE